MKIELLSPAKDISIGRSAILSGADAVYIGAEGFGARVGASNSMSEIEQLCRFAHGFGARVYLTMNTILYDSELEQARAQAMQAWSAGVDALIVQDMAYLEMGLPIELHASTQTFNFSVDKVQFLEQSGFARVVLERGLSFVEIKEIRAKSGVELEAFIHGAICVGYSGQCYLSQAVTGRSGNRGECAQLCRSSYDLKREDEVLAKNEAILSVGDMCMGERVKDLIDAGVCSLKIEGRLKNENYVVNNTAYYNNILNDLGVERSSDGVSRANFEADPSKSFLRVPTIYFFDNKRNHVGAPTKSLGEFIGTVERVGKNDVLITNGAKLNNGDGICWRYGAVINGSNVNRVDGNQILARGLDQLRVGMEIYRNLDVKFDVSSRNVDRRIGVKIVIGTTIEAIDSTGIGVSIERPQYETASNKEKAIENLKRGFSKSGETIFEITEVEIATPNIPFMPSSQINELRRKLLDKLLQVRLNSYQRRVLKPKSELNIKIKKVDYLANVSNSLSEQFFRERGVEDIEKAVEVSGIYDGKELLRSRFCVRRERGLCPKENQKQTMTNGNAGDLIIENNGKRLALHFDCVRCEMTITLKS